MGKRKAKSVDVYALTSGQVIAVAKLFEFVVCSLSPTQIEILGAFASERDRLVSVAVAEAKARKEVRRG